MQGGSKPGPDDGPLFEGNPVGEGTARSGTDTPVHRPETTAMDREAWRAAIHGVATSRTRLSE